MREGGRDITPKTQQLQNSRLLRTESEIRDFEQAIETIRGMNDVTHISHLCTGFDDSTEQEEVMFGLVHAIESYDVLGLEQSLRVLAESVPILYPHAIGWGKTLHKRILNHEPTRTAYAEVVSTLDSSRKERIVRSLKEIQADNPDRFESAVGWFLQNID